MDTLTVEHPRWEEFVDKLESALGEHCDNTLRCATQVLRDMGGIDIDGTLAYCAEHGGHCSCEILMNTDKLPGDDDPQTVLGGMLNLVKAGLPLTVPAIASASGLPAARTRQMLVELAGRAAMWNWAAKGVPELKIVAEWLQRSRAFLSN
jgi:hypothetical protein